MLHTLGLRENPPSSAEISAAGGRALRRLTGAGLLPRPGRGLLEAREIMKRGMLWVARAAGTGDDPSPADPYQSALSR